MQLNNTGFPDLEPSFSITPKTNDSGANEEINKQAQRLLTTTSISGAQAKPTKFDPIEFLYEMQTTLQHDLVQKQLMLSFLSIYDEEEDENPDIFVGSCKLEIHSQCKASFVMTTSSRMDTDSLGDDSIVRLFALDTEKLDENVRIDIVAPSIFDPTAKAADDDDVDASFGCIKFYHPTLGHVQFQMSENRRVTWTDVPTKQKTKSKNNKQTPHVSPLQLYISFDYMSFSKS